MFKHKTHTPFAQDSSEFTAQASVLIVLNMMKYASREEYIKRIIREWQVSPFEVDKFCSLAKPAETDLQTLLRNIQASQAGARKVFLKKRYGCSNPRTEIQHFNAFTHRSTVYRELLRNILDLIVSKKLWCLARCRYILLQQGMVLRSKFVELRLIHY